MNRGGGGLTRGVLADEGGIEGVAESRVADQCCDITNDQFGISEETGF